MAGLNVMDWNDLRELEREDLLELLDAYDNYIIAAFDDQEKIDSGWVPVCVLEFANSEEFDEYRAINSW